MSKVLRTGKAGRSWAVAVLLEVQKVSLLHVIPAHQHCSIPNPDGSLEVSTLFAT